VKMLVISIFRVHINQSLENLSSRIVRCKNVEIGRESLVSDIPAGDRKIVNLFLQCSVAPPSPPLLFVLSSDPILSVVACFVK
jgi:hypothetical protein